MRGKKKKEKKKKKSTGKQKKKRTKEKKKNRKQQNTHNTLRWELGGGKGEVNSIGRRKSEVHKVSLHSSWGREGKLGLVSFLSLADNLSMS